MGLFEEAAGVLRTARHEGLVDISDSDKGQPFSIRILDAATLGASAYLNAVCTPKRIVITLIMHTQLQQTLFASYMSRDRRVLSRQSFTSTPFARKASQAQYITVTQPMFKQVAESR